MSPDGEKTCSAAMEDLQRLILSDIESMYGPDGQPFSELPYYSPCFRFGETEHPCTPAFDRILQLIFKMESYSFRQEAYRQMDRMGTVIKMQFPHMVPWFRMRAKMYEGYRLPVGFDLRQNCVEPGDRIIEDAREHNGIITFLWHWKNAEDMVYQSQMATGDLIEWAVQNEYDGTIWDRPSHEGEHLQSIHKIPKSVLIQERINFLLPLYLKDQGMSDDVVVTL